MNWDNKETVILKTLKGEECNCPPNLQRIKREIVRIKELNSLGLVVFVSKKFNKTIEGYQHGLKLIIVD